MSWLAAVVLVEPVVAEVEFVEDTIDGFDTMKRKLFLRGNIWVQDSIELYYYQHYKITRFCYIYTWEFA